MKNKLGLSIEKLGGEIRTSDSSSELNGRRDSPAPRIVVCPPMEDGGMTPPAPVARGSLFGAISRRISRRRADEDESGSSSGSDSVSCERESRRARDTDRSSCSISDSSEGSEPARRHRSTISFRKVFQSLSISPRSRSSTAAERPRQPKKNPQPKRILRPPVTYTYVRGLSGLPTQRIARPRQLTISGLHR